MGEGGNHMGAKGGRGITVMNKFKVESEDPRTECSLRSGHREAEGPKKASHIKYTQGSLGNWQ